MNSHTWNHQLAGLQAGQLSFLLRAGTKRLPTPLNLRRWKFRAATCSLCNSPNPTIAHILNGCQEALNQGRFTWRHDSILNCLVSLVCQKVPPHSKLYADLPGLRANESPPATIPTNLSTTLARPDLVLISGLSITMLELTVPFNSRKAIRAARDRKKNKPNYQQLVGDLKIKGLHISFNTLEIGSQGHYEPEAIHCIRHVFDLSGHEAAKILLKLSRTAVECSNHILNCSTSQSWDSNKPL